MPGFYPDTDPNAQRSDPQLDTLAASTAAFLALANDADNTALRATLELGTAATKNTGTTSATVALGDAPAGAVTTHVAAADPHGDRAFASAIAAGGDSTGTLGNLTNTQARGLKSATTTVAVSAAAAPTSGQVLTATGDSAATWQTPASSVSWPTGTFGDGSDGSADLDGTNTYGWASKSGSVYTMTRDALLTNITVRNGATLVKRYILFVNGTMTVEATGIVHDDGNAGSGSTAGGNVSATRRPVSAGQGGAAGRTTTGAGAAVGVNQTASFGGSGGTGGASGLGQAGGAPGGVTAPTAAMGSARTLYYALGGQLMSNTTPTNANGGSGGGAGGANVGTGTATSGGGGSGAPCSILLARVIANSGTIRADGGAGGNAAQSGDGQAGGGAGGGGGLLVIVTNTSPLGGTVTAAGGAGGAGAGGGSVGDNGVAGSIVLLAP